MSPRLDAKRGFEAARGAALAGAVTAASLIAFAEPNLPFDVSDTIAVFALTFLLALPVTISVVVIVGVPVTRMLVNTRRGLWWTLPSAGALIGTAVITAAGIIGTGKIQLKEDWGSVALLGGITGAVTGAVWWWEIKRLGKSELKRQP